MTWWSEGPGAPERPSRTPLWGAGESAHPGQGDGPTGSERTDSGQDPRYLPAGQTPTDVVGRATTGGDRPAGAWDAWNWGDLGGEGSAYGPGSVDGPRMGAIRHLPGQIPVGSVPLAQAGAVQWQHVPGATPGTLAGGPPARGRGPGWAAVLVLLTVTGVISALAGGLLGAGLAGGLPGQLPTVAAGSTARPDGTLARVAADALPSVVTIRSADAIAGATGSGFVYDHAGHVVTNNHVVEGIGTDLVVVLGTGERVPATVVGTDSAYDIAVLATGRSTLRPLTMGDSAAVVVGDPVLAVGAPLGLSSTVTSGIVSALNRPVVAGDSAGRSYINAIQTDAAINPGNSGGPLLDASGLVIGVNSAIATPPGTGSGSAGNIGLGFAIPSDQVVKTANQLIRTGHADHPVIGVLLDEAYAGPGARVRDADSGVEPVTAGGPAAKAGMKPGDVIVRFDGREITDSSDLIVAIRARSVGDTVALTVRRDGRTMDVRMTLQAAPKN